MAADALEIKTRISRSEAARTREQEKRQAQAADLTARGGHPTDKPETKPRNRNDETRSATAKDHKISERKLRNAAEIKKLDHDLADMVRAGNRLPDYTVTRPLSV